MGEKIEAEKLPKWVWFIPVILIVLFLGIGLLKNLAKTNPKIAKMTEPLIGYVATQAPAEKFSLAMGKDTPTVWAGPGMQYRIRGNKPYLMNRVLTDGNVIPYEMPAGWETLTGVEPAGCVRLMAKEEGTFVEVIRVK